MKLEKKASCECLYSDTQEICCVSKHGDNCEKTFNVSVERDQHFSTTTTSITVKVDDMLNSFVFYSGRISIFHYQKIKKEYGLLIDFEDFIGFLINLLKKCNKNCKNGQTIYTLQLDYNGTGETPEYSLQVMETNYLRRFCTLSISLTACDENEIRAVLRKSFKLLQEVNDSLVEELRKQTDEIQTLKMELQEKTTALETANKSHVEDVKKARIEHAETISREKERMDIILSEYKEKHRVELVQREEQHTKEKHHLECSLKDVKMKLRENEEKCKALQHDNEGLSGVIERLQECERSAVREITKLRSLIEVRDASMREKQATNSVLTARYRALLKDFSLIAEKVKNLQRRLDASVKSEAKLRNDIAEGERRLQVESERAARGEQHCRQLEVQLADQAAAVARLQAELASKEGALRSSEATAAVLSRQLRQLQLQQQRCPRAAAIRPPLDQASASGDSCSHQLKAEPQPAAIAGATSSYFYKRL